MVISSEVSRVCASAFQPVYGNRRHDGCELETLTLYPCHTSRRTGRIRTNGTDGGVSDEEVEERQRTNSRQMGGQFGLDRDLDSGTADRMLYPECDGVDPRKRAREWITTTLDDG
jgi:hypothetical protein